MHDFIYDVMDGSYAVVTGGNLNGTRLMLGNGEKAFAFGCINLKSEAMVICTVLRKLTKRRLVTTDAVTDYYNFV